MAVRARFTSVKTFIAFFAGGVARNDFHRYDHNIQIIIEQTGG